jgi:hypothetical protein
MRLAIVLALAACTRAPVEEKPPPVPVPVPPTPVVDERLACRSDADCTIFTSCCAHCTPTGTVIALNKQYAALGSMLTFTFYCPMCAEGGCSVSPPKREPICKAGQCARRDTITDQSGNATTVEVLTDPAHLKAREELELFATIMHRGCLRFAACGAAVTAAKCAELAIPMHSTCAAAKRCYAAIDKLPCPPAGTPFDLTALGTTSKLPECEEAVRACKSPP